MERHILLLSRSDVIRKIRIQTLCSNRLLHVSHLPGLGLPSTDTSPRKTHGTTSSCASSTSCERTRSFSALLSAIERSPLTIASRIQYFRPSRHSSLSSHNRYTRIRETGTYTREGNSGLVSIPDARQSRPTTLHNSHIRTNDEIFTLCSTDLMGNNHHDGTASLTYRINKRNNPEDVYGYEDTGLVTHTTIKDCDVEVCSLPPGKHPDQVRAWIIDCFPADVTITTQGSTSTVSFRRNSTTNSHLRPVGTIPQRYTGRQTLGTPMYILDPSAGASTGSLEVLFKSDTAEHIASPPVKVKGLTATSRGGSDGGLTDFTYFVPA